MKLYINLLLLKIKAFSKDFTEIKQFLLQQEYIKLANHHIFEIKIFILVHRFFVKL